MLNVKKFTFNPFSENTYVVTDQLNNSVIIDLLIKDNLNNNVNKIFVKTTYPHHLI